MFRAVKGSTLSLALAALVAMPTQASAQANQNGLSVSDEMVNEAYSLTDSMTVSLDIPEALDQSMIVTVPFKGQQYELVLTPHSVRAPGYRVIEVGDGEIWNEVKPGPVLTKRGYVNGIPGSSVVASASELGLEAIVRLPNAEFNVEPLAAEFDGVSTDLHVVYDSDDIFCDDTKRCGVDHTPAPNGGGSNGSNKAACDGIRICELACEADYEYFQLKGSTNNVESAINTIINAVNTQYERDVDIRHDITTIIVWTTSNDPYTSNSPGNHLSQMRSYWNANNGSIQRDVASQFTNKNWSGSGGVIGIAYLNGICNNNGYDVCRHISNANCRADLSAHELGHNWSAGHCSCSGFTMNAYLTCARQFSNGTINQIKNYASNRNCLGCESTDVCQTDLGFGGPGTGEMSLCGGDLSAGTTATLLLENTGVSNQLGFLFAGPFLSPLPFRGGTLYPNPLSIAGAFFVNILGNYSTTVPGSSTPQQIYLQAVYGDPGQAQGVGISNVLRVIVP